MAKDGSIVDLKHNWPKEQLVQKANYNWKSINKRIQKLETDIKSGVYMKNYSNKQNGDSNNSTVSNVQSTTNYNDDSGYDSQGAKNPSIEAVKNAVAEVLLNCKALLLSISPSVKSPELSQRMKFFVRPLSLAVSCQPVLVRLLRTMLPVASDTCSAISPGT